MMIYVSDGQGEPTQEDLANHYELIPQNSWGGSLIDCGLREGYVLYFTNRQLPNNRNAAGYNQESGRRETSHPREGSGNNAAGPLGSPKLPPVNQIQGSGVIESMTAPAGQASASGAGNSAFAAAQNKDKIGTAADK